MAFQFHKIKGWSGLSNRRDPRDIGNGLSKAQNISLDVGGKIRTIGGLADFTKVDGATALTQTAKIAPGSGLFRYGSDHWRGVDNVVDLLSQANAASDHDADNDGPNATTGWAAIAGSGTLASVGDTDGTTIASNSTTYILKLTNGTDAAYVIGQSATTVVGQRYILSSDLYNLDATDVELFVGTTSGGGEYGTKLHSAASWSNHIIEFVATTTTVHVSFWSHSLTGEIVYIDDVYLSKIPRSDLDTNWLALADVANAQVDLYNINDDSFTAGLLDFGTVSSYVATIDTINFPTTKTITDSTSRFLNQGIQAGDIRIISGSALNNIMFVVEHVTAGTIRARGNPFVVDADDDGTITLTKYNPVAFHYVNEALRASPANGGIALRPKHYSFADRVHFEGTESSERKFSAWYAKDVGPVAPTDVEATTGNGDGAATNLTAGAGFEIGITRTADDGDWIAGTYIIACAFRYDDGQVSALFVPSADEEFGTAILDSDSLTLTVRAKNDYDERISGGYIFCRKDESDDAWILLAEMSMADGARATLLGTYNAWAESDSTGSGAVDVAYTANFKSLHPNVDSYESISGIDPTTNVETFAGVANNNTFWNTSVIARNRCFIGSVRYTTEGGALSHFRDRILYSTAGAFDTFPIDNYIDVVQGDAEDYVKLGAYGNDLLCFKESTLYIVDISDPDPAGWQMKQDKNKGKYPRRGIAHPGAYFETPHGPAWCNKFGVFLYNGSEIVPLLGDKIELSEHPLAYQRYMEFDGTDDYVLVADDDDLDPGTSDWSVEAIVRSPSSASGTDIFISKSDAAPPDDSWGVYFNSGKLSAYFRADGTDAMNTHFGGTSKSDGEWYHIAVTFDRNGNAIGYVNAVAEPTVRDISSSDGKTMNNAVDMAIGANNEGTSSRYEGDIALVRLWTGILSQADLTNLVAGAPSSSIAGKTLKAEYLPKSIGDATWVDTSGNSLDGTVVGATAIYPDDWKSFYTDYSILGHHARTNQLIVIRDCTGKWSSGQDYGDCMIVDLDTGAITTGRRIFTKGIAYSNWATDWYQNLIIAEQTTSTSVTIKQWSDEPQSQAAGLIDVRTADIDFGNPAYAKFFDALVAYYKSSAAQTTPFSYALDGDDRFVAWTRLTGNFDPEEFWEKLTLEPTAFECDTIRFKLDNPTAAGIMELNDLTLRYSEETEDID